jgi:hypothetical protein
MLNKIDPAKGSFEAAIYETERRTVRSSTSMSESGPSGQNNDAAL